MTYSRVPRPQTSSLLSVEIAALLVFALAVLAIAMSGLLSLPVDVDGRSVRVRYGSTVGDLEAQGVTSARQGDLLAAADARVIEEGGGRPTQLFVDGSSVEPDCPLVRPATIRSVDGADVVEDVSVQEEPIPMSVLYEGEGSLVGLSQTGNIGRRRVSRGTVTRQVVDTLVLEAPVPMVFVRTAPAPGDRVVALTFDDGPWPGQTEPVLDILAAGEVPATFFMLGVQVRSNPQLAVRVAAEGHSIGNHTNTHRILRRSTADDVETEMRTAQDVITQVTGVSPTWFRPPGGLVSPGVYEASRRTKLNVIGWTVDPQDWRKKDAERLVEEVLAAVEPGAVILLHDGGGDRSGTIAALPRIIDGVRAAGYTFVRVEELPRVTGD